MRAKVFKIIFTLAVCASMPLAVYLLIGDLAAVIFLSLTLLVAAIGAIQVILKEKD